MRLIRFTTTQHTSLTENPSHHRAGVRFASGWQTRMAAVLLIFVSAAASLAVSVSAKAGSLDPIFSDSFEGDGVPTATGSFNDTGLTWSGHATSGNATTCNPAHPAGQDCHYGRDALARLGTLPPKTGASTPNNGINNGFDFTKISNSGTELNPSATLGSNPNDWACTRDNVTGLVWEVKTTSGLRSQDHGYTWYMPDNTYGGPGEVGDTSTCSNTLSGQNCNTDTYKQTVNAQGLCGHNDWRVPTVKELEGIVDLGRVDPAIDTGYFPNTPSSTSFWSGSPVVYDSNNAWSVFFYVGFAHYGDFRSDARRVRLVRAGQ